MRNGEWSLVSFTLLSQFSVGLVLGLGFVYFAHQSIYNDLATALTFRSPELIILFLIILATLFSFFHLGNPQHSFNAVNNLKGSWISREILMLSMFGFGVLLMMIGRIMQWPVNLTQFLIVFNGITGVVFILSMSGIYMIPTIPAWNNFFTPFSFISSALVFGSMGMMVLIHLANPNAINSNYVQQTTLFISILILLILAASVFHYYQLSKLEFTGIAQVRFDKGGYFLIFIIRMILLGIVLAGTIYILQLANKQDLVISDIQAIIIIICCLIVVEEMMGRYLFYASYFRVGV